MTRSLGRVFCITAKGNRFATRGMAWLIEGKLNYRDDATLKDMDPGTFEMVAEPLPK